MKLSQVRFICYALFKIQIVMIVLLDGYVSDEATVPDVSNLVTSHLNTTALLQYETDTNSTHKATSVNPDETSTDFIAVNKTEGSIVAETDMDVGETSEAPFIPNTHEMSNQSSEMKGVAQDSTTRKHTTALHFSSSSAKGKSPDSTTADPEKETNTSKYKTSPHASTSGFTATDNAKGTAVPNTKPDTDKTTEAPSINNKHETLNQRPKTNGTTPGLTSENPITLSHSDIASSTEPTTNFSSDSEETTDATSSSSGKLGLSSSIRSRR